MTTATRPAATLDDLLRIDGKAELIAGRIVRLKATGFLPNQIAGEIFFYLKLYVRAARRGAAFTDNMGFAVPRLTSGRQSFSPDAAWFAGPPPVNPMRCVAGPPTFAVEVRSEGDYGPAAEAAMAAKRADYFEAGTLAVWDVDPAAVTIHAFRADSPQAPVTFRRGDAADAEPALPGWRVLVSDLFA